MVPEYRTEHKEPKTLDDAIHKLDQVIFQEQQQVEETLNQRKRQVEEIVALWPLAATTLGVVATAYFSYVFYKKGKVSKYGKSRRNR